MHLKTEEPQSSSTNSPNTVTAFAPTGDAKSALRRVDELLKAGYTHIVDADLKSYFDTIPHDGLMSLVGQKVSDSRVLKLIEAFLKQGVLDGLREWTPEKGSPQGAVISPLLSNIYLNPLDHLMAKQGFEMIRYADDFVIMCRSPEEAARALAVVQEWDGVSRPDPASEQDTDHRRTGRRLRVSGLSVREGKRFPRAKSLMKLKDTIRAKTKRTSGKCLRAIIQSLNPTLRGWFGYFKHSYKTTFSCAGRLDSDEAAKHPPETQRSQRTWSRFRSSSLAECLLCSSRAV